MFYYSSMIIKNYFFCLYYWRRTRILPEKYKIPMDILPVSSRVRRCQGTQQFQQGMPGGWVQTQLRGREIHAERVPSVPDERGGVVLCLQHKKKHVFQVCFARRPKKTSCTFTRQTFRIVLRIVLVHWWRAHSFTQRGSNVRAPEEGRMKLCHNRYTISMLVYCLIITLPILF